MTLSFQALYREPECIDWLSTRSGVVRSISLGTRISDDLVHVQIYGGGPLNKEVGDHLTSRGVSIFVLYGS